MRSGQASQIVGIGLTLISTAMVFVIGAGFDLFERPVRPSLGSLLFFANILLGAFGAGLIVGSRLNDGRISARSPAFFGYVAAMALLSMFLAALAVGAILGNYG